MRTQGTLLLAALLSALSGCTPDAGITAPERARHTMGARTFYVTGTTIVDPNFPWPSSQSAGGAMNVHEVAGTTDTFLGTVQADGYGVQFTRASGTTARLEAYAAAYCTFTRWWVDDGIYGWSSNYIINIDDYPSGVEFRAEYYCNGN